MQLDHVYRTLNQNTMKTTKQQNTCINKLKLLTTVYYYALYFVCDLAMKYALNSKIIVRHIDMI